MNTRNRAVSPWMLAAALSLSGAAQSGTPAPAAILGTVVDAACYLMHPQAANGPSHDECGEACALAGVPLGIVDTESKQLYLADEEGTKRLLPHLHHVRVDGRAVKKGDPLMLEMPVGQGNTMSVRLDGGYMALTVNRVARVP